MEEEEHITITDNIARSYIIDWLKTKSLDYTFIFFISKNSLLFLICYHRDYDVQVLHNIPAPNGQAYCNVKFITKDTSKEAEEDAKCFP